MDSTLLITPEQRAEEVFGLFTGFRISHTHVRKCARNYCDAVINTYKHLQELLDPEPVCIVHEIAYWNKVKVALDKIGKQKDGKAKKTKKAKAAYLSAS